MQYLQEGNSRRGRLPSERPAEAAPDGHLRLVPPVEVLHDGESEAVGRRLVLRFSVVVSLAPFTPLISEQVHFELRQVWLP